MAVSGHPYPNSPSVIKLGVDVHQGSYVVVAQEDHATPPCEGQTGMALRQAPLVIGAVAVSVADDPHLVPGFGQ